MEEHTVGETEAEAARSVMASKTPKTHFPRSDIELNRLKSSSMYPSWDLDEFKMWFQ